MAQAVKASGGIVIVQVENLARAGTLHPQQVKVPGVCVDYIVVATKPQMQTRRHPVQGGPAGQHNGTPWSVFRPCR